MAKTLRILVVGASGFLGKKIVTMLSPHYEVIPTYNKNPIPNGIQLDATNSYVEEMLEKIKPNVIVHTVGIPSVYICETQKKKAWKTNVESLRGVVNYCSRTNVRLIWISSDYVFSGENPPYSISSKRSPINYYGVTKVEGENLIMKNLSNYAIIRCDIFYGYNDNKDNSFPLNVISTLKSHKEFIADDMRKRYPTFIDDVAKLILGVIKRETAEVFHASSLQGITKYQWARLIAREFKLDSELVLPDYGIEKNKPKDVRMILSPEAKDFVSVGFGLRIMRKQMCGLV